MRILPQKNLPSGNILRVFTVASAVGVSDLEDCSDGATVLPSDPLEADVVLAAILGVSVAAERAGAGHLARSGAGETVCYFWGTG